MASEKTNVMRKLSALKLPFKEHYYEGVVSGSEVADAMGEDHSRVFKTLVTVGKSGNHYVFMVPVDEELDLKKAALQAGEKSSKHLYILRPTDLTLYFLAEVGSEVRLRCPPATLKRR